MNKISKSLKQSNYITIIIVTILCLFVLFTQTNLLSKLFSFKDYLDTGYTKEVKNIEFVSTGWDLNESGSIKVKKNAEWTNKQEVTIKMNIETLDISKNLSGNTNRHIILVIDTSESMNGGRMSSLRTAVSKLTDELFQNSENKLSIISFNTQSEIVTDFTNNKTYINNLMNSLEAKGSTNYYLALKQVENLLSTYTQPENTDTHMIFITDGYPTSGQGLHETQYKTIMEKYPYLITSAIQLEMGTSVTPVTKSVSQYQRVAHSDTEVQGSTLETILLDVAKHTEYYESINVTDYVNNEFFTIADTNQIKTTYGSVEVIQNDNEQKIEWSIPEGIIKSGTSVNIQLEFKIKLKDEYKNTEAFLPTNSSTTVKATAPHITDMSFTTTNTTVLRSLYEIVYNANIPAGCQTTYEYTIKYAPFDTVTIRNEQLTCPGNQFKGWEVTDNRIKLISDETFIMPTYDIEIGAKWSELAISKSMFGTINSRTSLYDVIALSATPDNIASEFVSSSTGINRNAISSDTNGKGVYTKSATLSNTKPIHYFRGAVTNNNVIFGGFCWQIIRTTNTGGIKIIYNGTPTNGQCISTGEATTIGTSLFNAALPNRYSSPGDVGYMYDAAYGVQVKPLGEDSWMQIGGASSFIMAWYSTSYMFGDSVTWDGTSYTLVNPVSYTADDKESIAGKYLCYISGGEATVCNWTYYMYINEYDNLMIMSLGNGDTYETIRERANNVTYIYGNDVVYNESTGLYTLQDTISLKPIEYGDNISIINGTTKRHYTCMSNTDTCSEVYYFFYDAESYSLGSYYTLTNGEKIEDILANSIINRENKIDSTIKTTIDTWYANNMTAYTYMLEDTIFCNERNVYTYSGFEKDGDSTQGMFFVNYVGANEDSCLINDSFTVSSSLGNGDLTYPVGLITASESRYAGSSYNIANTSFYLYNGLNQHTMTPNHQSNTVTYATIITEAGGNFVGSVNDNYYVRPVVSLKPGVFASDGDGTPLNPYIIEME